MPEKPKPSLRFAILFVTAGIVLGLIVAIGFNLTEVSQTSPVAPEPNIVLGSATSSSELGLQQVTADAFVRISEIVVPTVVTIHNTKTLSADELAKLHDSDLLKDFFRFRSPKDFQQRGSGSGIIVSDNGYILTNVHVVEKSDKLKVILSDNREFDAKIAGLDPLTEVAVIKVDASGLPVARLGDSDEVRVGQWVLAVGNPLELRSTVTAGIISAKERQIDIMRDTYSVESFLQTDAAINPGNSGGALVNLNAEVVGVNTAIATETGYNAGFGFAIPINLAKKIMNDIVRKGRVERGYLGIAMQNIDEKKARALHLERPLGVFIDRVLRDSPAGKAGLQSKDVLLKVDGKVVNKSNRVQAIIAEKSPGDRIALDIWRKGTELKLHVTLSLKEPELSEIAQSDERPEFDNLGLTAEDLASNLSEHGAIITSVADMSPANEADLRQDDIVLEIDNTKIHNANDLYMEINKLKEGSVSIFTVKRFGEKVHLFVEVPSR